MQKPLLKLFNLIILLTIYVVVQAQKTDKVFLKNGDVLTGKIKTLKFAKLKFDMTGPGIIDIKWEEITKIKSDKRFQITMRNGDVLLTSLDSLFFESRHATLEDIVEIVQIKSKFIQRLEGDVTLGFNYAKASENVQFNFGTDIVYRKPKTETNLELNSILNHDSKDSFVSKKQDATIDIIRKLKHSLYINPFMLWQQNTQLGLENRYLISANGGKIFINSNQQRLLAGAGLSFNLEKTTDSSAYKKNLEGLLIFQYKRFRYSTPKLSLDVQYIIYPGITDWGRVRTDFQFNSKIEIFKDFNVGLIFYNIFDNRPATDAKSKNDFGINFFVGFEFGK